MQTIEDHPDPNRRWRNRRWMAWTSLVAGLLYPILFWAVDSQNLADIALPFYLFVSAVVGLYVGFSTAETMSLHRKG